MAAIGSGQGRLSGRISSLMLAMVLAVMAALAILPARAGAATGDPAQVSFTLQGCANDGSFTLPRADGKFICADARYTTGNLDKNWAELDLVPHRLIAKAGNSAPATQTYKVAVVLDAEDDGHPGYDVLSVPELNTALSSSGCTAPVVGNELIKSPGIGGVSKSRYRILTITQAKNKTCVYDFYGRLALGSHNFPGSSLHANLANQNLGTAGIGSKEVSIPLKKLGVQELGKDMSAARNVDYTWNITKSPTPARVHFEDSCQSSEGVSADVSITVEWEKIPASGNGKATIVTNVYATNPASRAISLDVTDRIYEGTTQYVLLDTSAPSGPVDVPANTTAKVMTHTTEVDSGASQFNDVVTATYVDKDTGVPVPGTLTAAAKATEVTAAQNDTAVITDVELITGDAGEHLSFAVMSVSNPLLGAFTDYVIGTKTRGPVTWTSNSQAASGSVTFNKTVYLDGPANTSGVLHDEASLVASNGFEATTAEAGIDIEASASVALTINKTIPDVLGEGESQVFQFHVTDAEGNEVAEPTVSFAAGETSKSVTVTGLAPGSYTVAEDEAEGWDEQQDQTVELALPECAGEVTFDNTVPEAHAKAVKVTVPAGSVAGWDMTLKGPGLPEAGETVTTGEDGTASFAAALQEGSYTIEETLKDGWKQDSDEGCSFTVDYPADAGREFTCTITNTRLGRIIVKKVTQPEGSEQAFDFTSKYGDFALADGESNDSGFLEPGSYAVSETVPAGWRQSAATCDDGSAPDAIDLEAGETVTCTFTNVRLEGQLHVVKTGPAFAYHGDKVTFSFAVTNTGEAPLSDVTVADDHCAVGATPASRSNDNGDDLLERLGTDGTTPEVWTFTCEYVIPAHADGEENPIHNTATVTAKDQHGKTLTASDDHRTTVLHPAVAITKTGPSGATQGDRVPYTLVVTNPGDTQLIGQTLEVTDPLCEAPPMLVSKGRAGGSDPSPDTLDPGDAWTYTCTVQTTTGMSGIDNVANVKGNDANGRVVANSATFRTDLKEKLGVVFDSGAAKLQGPAGCVKRSFAFTVRGKHIAKVELRVNGKRYKTVRVKGKDGKKVTVRINPKRYRVGKVQRVTVRVTFNAASKTKAKTMRAVFQRCKPLKIKPNFTG